MYQYKIMLCPEQVKCFVDAAGKCEFEVDVCYNRYTVDAKSIVGVLGLDFKQVLTVTCHGYDAGFEQMLRTFSIAS